MPKRLLDLPDLLESWCRQLRGDRKSAETQRAYRLAVEGFLAYCADAGVRPEITKANVTGWMAAQHDCATATVRLRLTALKRFAAWLSKEEGFDNGPLAAIMPPKLAQAPVADLSDNEIVRMLKVCEGTALRDKRDRAMLALLTETGLRAAELLALDITDIDLDACLLQVRKGKGDKPRRVRFSSSTATAIDRYNRARRLAIRRPAEGPLWLSDRGRRLSYTGLVATLKGRAADAGVIGFHIHRTRHTAAVRWMRAGGSETGLRAHAGWADNTMIARYVKTASEQLAAEEFDRLGLGLGEI
jgi:site-specific recombinase XerD